VASLRDELRRRLVVKKLLGDVKPRVRDLGGFAV
jgi:hypothetical protein